MPNPVSALVLEAAPAPCVGLVSALQFPTGGAYWRLLPEPRFSRVSFSELFCPHESLALSGIVSSSAQQTPGIDQHSELFCPADPLAVTIIDGDPRGRLALCPLAPGQRP
nr:uncharacterized protein LOC112423040 [Macaca nemestrina]